VVEDPLHGICPGCTPQTIGGNDVTLLGSSGVTNFGFGVSPVDKSGTLQLKFLLPTSTVTLAQATTFASFDVVSGTGVKSDITLFGGGSVFSTGQLDAFLGVDASPTNPIGAFLGATNFTISPDTTGYYVALADTGVHSLTGPGVALTAANTFSLDPALFPQGGLILANLYTADGVIATANSGALFNDNGGICLDCTPTPTAVPGPTGGVGAIPAFFGLLGYGLWRLRRREHDEAVA